VIDRDRAHLLSRSTEIRLGELEHKHIAAVRKHGQLVREVTQVVALCMKSIMMMLEDRCKTSEVELLVLGSCA
jgi:hypothetical protein